jgi:hypothetical protein
MKRGPKPETVNTKLARGTYQPCRDAGKVQIDASDDPPEMPDYLTPDAELVWHEIIGRVVHVGVTEPDSAMLARYCAVEAICRSKLGQGDSIPSSVMTALRQMEELLGIAGPKSRVGRVAEKRDKPKGFGALRAVA